MVTINKRLSTIAKLFYTDLKEENSIEVHILFAVNANTAFPKIYPRFPVFNVTAAC
jgi:hypothetical protein